MIRGIEPLVQVIEPEQPDSSSVIQSRGAVRNKLVVQLVVVLVHVLQEVRSQGRREWMRKIGVDHNRRGRI